ncbi:MAG: GGDEF domain-containing protein [Betaproteobacteria bacterium]|nr:GGDEF domain-containing protein [Betaproteobacteria bacterium]
MSMTPQRFSPEWEAEFQASRRAALAEVNASTYGFVAGLVMVFSAWDWYVDPGDWLHALPIRILGAAIAIALGVLQKQTGRVDWAPAIAKARFAATTLAVAGALLVLDQGFEFGIAGVVSMVLVGPYLAMDRRDLLKLYAVPAVCIAFIMVFGTLNRFAIINSTIFLVLAVLVGMILARVFESANRRAFVLEQQLKTEARTDSLTGLVNRRAMEAAAAAELKRARRNGGITAVMILDIDHFKSINDRFGHDVGDQVIISVSTAIQAVIRETDTLARWGGEEFLALLPSTHLADALALADRIRRAVASAPMPAENAAAVTVSIGVASSAEVTEDLTNTRWTHMLRAADSALYRAKQAGRNRVCSALVETD